MDQHAINNAEWMNPSNWTGPKWLSVYFSKRDSRAWVPKQVRALGWTVNLGQPAGVRWFLGIVAGIMTAMLGTAVWVATVY
jgi:uncharacterized membrane protein